MIPKPPRAAKVFNDEPDVVIDGGGGAIFFVSNDRTGHVGIAGSVLDGNPSGRFQTQPGIYYEGADPAPIVTTSTIR